MVTRGTAQNGKETMMNNRIGEECGIFAIYDPDGDCARSAYYGLYALQHRGQESCGIAVNNDRNITYYKDMGLVSEVFDNNIIERLGGTMAVGHVRYSTTGGSMRENAQPLVLRYCKGNLAIAHNGNLINKPEIEEKLSRGGAIFQTTSDTEMIAYMIARHRLKAGSVESAVEKTIGSLAGAFSLVIMSPQKLIACRDPWGFRPLCMGRKGSAVVFASETCALDTIGADYERDLKPGEIVIVKNGEITSIDTYVNKYPHTQCIFEYLYFSRPDSILDGQDINESRELAGRLLAREFPTDADVVIGVPDSGLSAAMGYAKESGIPYGIGFVKNKYIGRSFIQPTQSMRENAVRIKLNVLRQTVEGKRVIMVDDSVVRGTTSKRIVSLLRRFGAKEVHVRSSAPPFKYPCYFGTDIPSRDQLLATGRTEDEMCGIIGADSLKFLPLEKLPEIIPHAGCTCCNGCFSGKYPIDIHKYLKGEND